MTDRLINWHHEKQTHRRKLYLTWQSNYFHHPSYRSPQAETWLSDQKIGRTITTDRSIFLPCYILRHFFHSSSVGKQRERNVFYDQHVASVFPALESHLITSAIKMSWEEGGFFLNLHPLQSLRLIQKAVYIMLDFHLETKNRHWYNQTFLAFQGFLLWWDTVMREEKNCNYCVGCPPKFWLLFALQMQTPFEHW